MSALFRCILFISISLTIAIPLDSTCTNDASCQDPTMICDKEKCHCISPSYIPCNSSCIVNRQHAYEGDTCAVQENCIENTICSVTKRCECQPGFTARNKLCLKNLYTACTNGAECWSEYCSSNLCQCTPGYEPKSDNITCTRKLSKIYNNWIEANRSNDFCWDQNSCIDIVAQCFNDTQHPSAKFCKCPDDYNLENNTKCVSVENALLSPLNPSPTSYGKCGYCKDRNAACMTAGDQKTCWCRSGYKNINNICVKQDRTKPLIIFPNSEDTKLHHFTNGCMNESNEVKDNLCVCASGYKLVDKEKPCEKINLEWTDDVSEYGLCTRITSGDKAKGEDGLCPEPLKCVAKKDKHVCSCGTDKFQDMDDPTQCVVFIGKVGDVTNDKCPTKNAARNLTSNICNCLPGYEATHKNRRCELKLSSQIFHSNCSSIGSDNKACIDLFGKTALLCAIGECRCSGNQSFPNPSMTHCTAPLNQLLVGLREDCPLISKLNNDRCVCEAGFQPSSDSRRCVILNIALNEYTEPSTTTTGAITTADCQALYIGQVELNRNGSCQCKDRTIINSDRSGCWYKLNVTIPGGDLSPLCPTNSGTGTTRECQCNLGYTMKGDKCERKTDRVFLDNDSTAPNIAGLTTKDCDTLFGVGAKLSDKGKYCTCGPAAYPNADNSYCYFLINTTTAVLIPDEECPANSMLQFLNSLRLCQCNPGYHVSTNQQTCESAKIDLDGTDNVIMPHVTNCVNYKDIDCTVKFGEKAFCKNEKCYCDRQSSFVNATNKCESLSKYTFPGVHERSSHACVTTQDCGSDSNVECDYLTTNLDYKVCKCKDGSLLDPNTQKCVKNRCPGGCNTVANFECRDYQCVCKDGFYSNGPVCTAITSNLQLNQICNASALGSFGQAAAKVNGLQCDATCQRVRCISGYKSSESKCVPYKLQEDQCVYKQDICKVIHPEAECNRENNKCLCKPSFYQIDQTCARAVDAPCKNAEECGNNMICKAERCSCTENQVAEVTTDISGRPITTCRNIINNNSTCPNNGIDQIRFTPAVLLSLLVLSRVFLT